MVTWKIPPEKNRAVRGGFSLLEVMIALAVMAGVVLTVLAAVNYHAGVVAGERDSTELTVLARFKMAEMEKSLPVQKGEGTLAPQHPDIIWKADLLPAELAGLQKLVLTVRRSSDKKEVALVRYLAK